MNAYFEERLSKAEAAGIPRDRIILDPASASARHGPQHGTPAPSGVFPFLGRPLLVDIPEKAPSERSPSAASGGSVESTLAVTALCAWQDVEILRFTTCGRTWGGAHHRGGEDSRRLIAIRRQARRTLRRDLFSGIFPSEK
jgi:hypothetical protein